MIVVFFMCISSSLFAKTNIKKANKLFDEALVHYNVNDNIEAEKYVLLAIKFDITYVNAYMLLADISDILKKPLQREWALEKVVEIDPQNIPIAYKLLGLCNLEKGLFDNALALFTKYSEFGIKKDTSFIKYKIEECINAEKLLNTKADVLITHLDSNVNTCEDEYWPFISADDSVLYFTRLITNEKNYAFERLFQARKNNSFWTPAQKLNIGNHGEVNEGTISMTADGRLIFFTACGRYDGFGSCDIYYIQKYNGEWLMAQNAGSVINTVYWDAQPSVSINGEYLYWSSNRPGGYGGKDIWFSKIISVDKGKLIFDRPVNVGFDVNTIKNDFSPFIHADGETLYFASEGHMGLGKSDLYLSRNVGNKWTTALNLGYPINSFKEDDGLVVSPTATACFLSSTRKTAINNSKDIFQFELPVEFLPQKTGYVKGFVFDNETREKLNVKIELTELESTKKTLIQADNEQGYITTLSPQKTYAFNIAAPGYLFYSQHFELVDLKNFVNASVFNIYLEPIEINARVILKNVFFDFDSFQLKEESVAELNKIIEFLRTNPRVKVEISGHTDNEGSSQYNQALSESRAKVISEYLIKNINSNRVTYKGFGSEYPVASNETDIGRSKNRRSELKIVAF